MPPAGLARTAVAAFAYHDVTDTPHLSGLQGRGAGAFKLSRMNFARHLEALAGTGHVPALVTALDLMADGGHLLLTFDDGGTSALYVSEELCRRGWRGHFFIVTGRIGERRFLDGPGIRELRRCGHVVGTHSHTHPGIFRDQTEAQMRAQWRTSVERLADILGEPCTVASVPGGDISRQVLETAATSELHYLFTSEPVLVPQRVERCWVLGRFCPKSTTAVDQIAGLAVFRGWWRPLLIRRLKGMARHALPGVYRRHVRYQSREGERIAAPPRVTHGL